MSNLQELKDKLENIISDLKNHGKLPKENDCLDYKKSLNTSKKDKNNFEF